MTKVTCTKSAVLSDGTKVELNITAEYANENITLNLVQEAVKKVEEISKEATSIAFSGYSAEAAKSLLLDCLNNEFADAE